MWFADIQETGVSKSTVNNRFRALRAFFNWCVAEVVVDQSPMRNIHTPSVSSIVIRVFSPEHVKTLLYLCPPNTWWGARDRAIIMTLLHTGIRLSELTGLQLSDLNFTSDCIRVRGKGDKERMIYLASEAQQTILRYLRHRNDGASYLWLSRQGTRLTSNAVQQVIRDLGRKASLSGVRCSAHTFRHTFAINFLKAGGSLRYLQEIMGHTSMKPLEAYLRAVSADGFRLAVVKLDFGGKGQVLIHCDELRGITNALRKAHRVNLSFLAWSKSRNNLDLFPGLYHQVCRLLSESITFC